MNKKNNKYVAVLSSAAVGTLLATTLATTALAKTDGFLVKDGAKYFEYSFDELMQSAVQKQLGDAPLYDDYKSKEFVAFHDDVKGYVNKDYVLNASVEKSMNGEKFDLDNYTEKEAPESAILKIENATKLYEKDGKVVAKEAEKKEEALKVESVSAITGTTVTVKLANAPENINAKDFTVSDSNNNVYASTKVEKVGEDYVLTLGMPVKGQGVLTVKYGESEATKEFDTTIEGTTLRMSVEDKDSILKADGADNTIITIEVLKDGKLDTSFKGTVKFESLKGATFSKQTLAFDKGVAKVQLNSISSVDAITDTIRATINNAEDLKDVGVTKEVTVKYVPQENTEDESVSLGFITYAEADQAGDVYVRFNQDMDFERLKADFTAHNDLITLNGNNPDGIEKVSANTVKLILNEEHKLDDNTTVEVKSKYTEDNKNSTLTVSSITFNLVDPKAPEAVAAKATDYRTISVEFTEAVSNTTTDKPSNWVLNGKVLEADDFANVGKKPEVGKYENDKDLRSFVTLQLSAKGLKKLNAIGEENLLQAYGIIDYAGLTDKTGNNKATTQEFRFKTPDAPAAPVVESVVKESPEQFRVKFNSPLKAALNASDFGFKYQDGVDAEGKAIWKTVELENAKATDAKATVTKVGTDNNEYLIELNEDWTQKLKTNTSGINYYAPKHNKVVISVNKANVKNEADVTMTEDYKSNEITLDLDSKSPEIKDATQVGSDEKVNVVMDKPVQINGKTTILTPSEKQTNAAGIPVPTFQFVSEDKATTIDGEIDGNVAVGDTEFVVKPVDGKHLTAGKWTLYIRSISDDIGNTSATTSKEVTIKAPEAEGPTAAKIMWADAHDNVNLAGDAKADNDVVHIQFATKMSLDSLTSTMYTINGKVLPQGVSITSEERKYDANNDGTIDEKDTKTGTLVTITLPKEFLGETNEEAKDTLTVSNAGNNMLNVSKSLKDAKGNKLSGKTEVKLTYDCDGVPNFVHVADLTGVTGKAEETTKGVKKVDGNVGSPKEEAQQEINTLTITNQPSTKSGNIDVTFNDGVLNVKKTVAVTQNAETTAVATKIKEAFDGQLKGYTVTVDGSKVVFTADTADADKNVTVTTVDTDGTGVGTPSATETKKGNKGKPEVKEVKAVNAQKEVNTLTVLSKAKAAGNIIVTFKDGTLDVTKTVAVAKDDTATAIAGKIQAAFNGQVAGYTVANAGDNVTFTISDVNGADDKNVVITLSEQYV